MTKKQAKELAIKKWQWIVDNEGSESPVSTMLKAIPQSEKLKWHCSYCELYYHTASPGIPCCKDCPLRYKGVSMIDKYGSINVGCRIVGHPYATWSANNSKENAQAVLDFIIAR